MGNVYPHPTLTSARNRSNANLGSTMASPTERAETRPPASQHMIAVTFVPHEVPRLSWFALWNPMAIAGGLFSTADAPSKPETSPADRSIVTTVSDLLDATDEETVQLQLVAPQSFADRPGAAVQSPLARLAPPAARASTPLRPKPARASKPIAHTIQARRIPMAEAYPIMAMLRTDHTASRSAIGWARALRYGLGAVAQSWIRPDVTSTGFDSWRLAPELGPDDRFIERAAEFVPPEGLCHGSTTVLHPHETVRLAFDSLADVLARCTAAEHLAQSHLFASNAPTKVPHLRPWVTQIRQASVRPPRVALIVASTQEVHTEGALQPISNKEHRAIATSGWTIRLSPQHAGRRTGAESVLQTLRTLRAAADRWAPILRHPLLSDASCDAEATVEIDANELGDLIEAADGLGSLGVDIEWPDEVSNASLVVALGPATEPATTGSANTEPATTGSANTDTASSTSTKRSTHNSKRSQPPARTRNSIIDTEWRLSAGDSPLTQFEVRQLLAAKQPIVKVRGQWVRVTPQLRAVVSGPTPSLQVGALAGGLLEGSVDLDGGHPELGHVALSPDGAWASMLEGLRTLTNPQPSPDIDGLDAALRPYQRRGVSWLTTLIELGVGGVLADDMGLGKTLQIIAAHRASLLRRLIDSASPPNGSDVTGPTLVVCPTSVVRNWAREINRFSPATDVVAFHGSNRSLDDLTSGSTTPDTIVLTSYGVLRRSTDILASVTWDLVVADEAQQLKNHRSATARAIRSIPAKARIAVTGTPIENRLADLWSLADWALPGLLGTHEQFKRNYALPVERDGSKRAMERLNRRVSPFILRRQKSDDDIAPDLPPKIEVDCEVELTTEQAELYAKTAGTHLETIRGVDGFERRGHVLAMLTALKKVTNHPAHFLEQTAPLADRSGKLERAVEIIDSARANGETVLLFTQYVKMAELIVAHLDSRGIRVGLLSGKQSIVERQRLVDDTQRGDLDVLILSLRAGGTGLTLTRASQVIHFDRWWNPAVEDQASDRAHRIGQQRTVIVHRLISKGTLEERIAAILNDKRQLAASLTAGTDAWICELSDDELESLVSLHPSLVSASPAQGELR